MTQTTEGRTLSDFSGEVATLGAPELSPDRSYQRRASGGPFATSHVIRPPCRRRGRPRVSSRRRNGADLHGAVWRKTDLPDLGAVPATGPRSGERLRYLLGKSREW